MAQFKFTVLLMPNGSDRITGVPAQARAPPSPSPPSQYSRAAVPRSAGSLVPAEALRLSAEAAPADGPCASLQTTCVAAGLRS